MKLRLSIALNVLLLSVVGVLLYQKTEMWFVPIGDWQRLGNEPRAPFAPLGTLAGAPGLPPVPLLAPVAENLIFFDRRIHQGQMLADLQLSAPGISKELTAPAETPPLRVP